MFRPNLIIIVVGLCFVFDSRLFVRAVCMPPDDWSYAGREREGGRKRMGEIGRGMMGDGDGAEGYRLCGVCIVDC